MVGETHVLEDERSAVAAGIGRPDSAEEGRGDGPGAGLRVAVGRLRCQLAAHRPLLPDRGVAEDELDELARQADNANQVMGLPDPERMRHSLLLVASALGSVRALAVPLGALREAVEQLAPPPASPHPLSGCGGERRAP